MKQEPLRDAAHGTSPHCLLSLVSYSTWDHLPRDNMTHNGLSPSQSSLMNQENAPQISLQEAFSQPTFPLMK